MSLLGKLFGKKKLTTNDPDFGEIESFSTKGNRIGWQIELNFLGSDIEILIEGDENGLNAKQKSILMKALLNEPEIHAESTAALKEQFHNADLEFESIEMHFDLRGISVRNEGLELAFQEKEGQNYFFNVHFENNKQVGVSIDG